MKEDRLLACCLHSASRGWTNLGRRELDALIGYNRRGRQADQIGKREFPGKIRPSYNLYYLYVLAATGITELRYQKLLSVTNYRDGYGTLTWETVTWERLTQGWCFLLNVRRSTKWKPVLTTCICSIAVPFSCPLDIGDDRKLGRCQPR